MRSPGNIPLARPLFVLGAACTLLVVLADVAAADHTCTPDNKGDCSNTAAVIGMAATFSIVLAVTVAVLSHRSREWTPTRRRGGMTAAADILTRAEGGVALVDPDDLAHQIGDVMLDVASGGPSSPHIDTVKSLKPRVRDVSVTAREDCIEIRVNGIVDVIMFGDHEVTAGVCVGVVNGRLRAVLIDWPRAAEAAGISMESAARGLEEVVKRLNGVLDEQGLDIVGLGVAGGMLSISTRRTRAGHGGRA